MTKPHPTLWMFSSGAFTAMAFVSFSLQSWLAFAVWGTAALALGLAACTVKP